MLNVFTVFLSYQFAVYMFSLLFPCFLVYRFRFQQDQTVNCSSALLSPPDSNHLFFRFIVKFFPPDPGQLRRSLTRSELLRSLTHTLTHP